MRAWGFVFLTYGIVWSAILVYVLRLWRKYRRIKTELALYQSEAQRNPSEERI